MKNVSKLLVVAALTATATGAKAVEVFAGYSIVAATGIIVGGLQQLQVNPSAQTSQETRLSTREMKENNKELILAAQDNAAIIYATKDESLMSPELTYLLDEMNKQIPGFADLSKDDQLTSVIQMAIQE